MEFKILIIKSQDLIKILSDFILDYIKLIYMKNIFNS